MTCKTCEHWKQSWRSGLSTDPKGPFGSCESPKIKQGYQYNAKDLLPDEAIVENDEGWGMETGPDFGCIHHKLKLPPSVNP